MIIDGVELDTMTLDGVEVQTWMHDGVEVYSAGRLVTYHVDTGVEYVEKIKKGLSALSPTTFTPEKSGWTFAGWREDSTASGDVLEEKVVEKDEITLYAVFTQSITLSYNGNGATSGSTAKQTAPRYYNNENITDATFVLRSNGFTKVDEALYLSWSGDGNEGGNSTVSYAFNGWNLGAAGATVTLSADATANAQWRRSKLYIKFYNYNDGSSWNIPWAADSSTTVDLSGFTSVVFSSSTWTAEGCGEPDWRVYINGAQVANIGGNQTTSPIAINHNGSRTLRFAHPQTDYRDQYSYGGTYITATFT